MILTWAISKNWGKLLHSCYYFLNYMTLLIYTFVEQLLTCAFLSDLAVAGWCEGV